MYQRRVTKVIDGDTFDVDRNIDDISRIRLADIDTPEKGSSGAVNASTALKALIENKNVDTDKVVIDDYGRIVANVYQGGTNINNYMKNQGW